MYNVHIHQLTKYCIDILTLDLLNEFGKRDKIRGLPSILSLFRNEFNKFINTRAQMLDSIQYHIRTGVMDVITFPENL